MQVCNPQENRQAHSQYPLHSRVSLEKTPNLTWLGMDNCFENWCCQGTIEINASISGLKVLVIKQKYVVTSLALGLGKP